MEVISIIRILFQVYWFMIIGYILLSWFPQARESPIAQILSRLVEPYLSIFRFIPPIGIIDISPIIALIALQFVQAGVEYIVLLVLRLVGV